MAKKKAERELTKEEKLQQEKRKGIEQIQRELPFINTPSYFFNIGDIVSYGAMKKSVVEDILYDGKVYVLMCIATNHNYGKPYDYETYRVTSWVEVRPVCRDNNTSFSENQNVRLDYYNSTMNYLS